MTSSGVSEPKTILVVDDTQTVLLMVATVLKAAHFNVLCAVDGKHAIALASAHEGQIDLLLSDVQMPGMSGPDLGISLKKMRPNMHVMLMSGLLGGDLLMLNYGWAYLQKPFVARKLVEMVNVVLSNPDKSQGSHGYTTSAENGSQDE